MRKHQLNQYPEFNSVEDLVKQGDDSWGYKQYILSMKKQRTATYKNHKNRHHETLSLLCAKII